MSCKTACLKIMTIFNQFLNLKSKPLWQADHSKVNLLPQQSWKSLSETEQLMLSPHHGTSFLFWPNSCSSFMQLRRSVLISLKIILE